MTTSNEARQEIYDTLKAAWEAAYPSSPLVFANEAFDSEGVAEWASLEVRQTGGGQDSLGAVGNRRFERRGLVFVQLYAAVNRGLARLDELSKTVLDTLEAKTLPVNSVFLYDGVFRELPPSGPWVRGSVTIQVTYDEIK